MFVFTNEHNHGTNIIRMMYFRLTKFYLSDRKSDLFKIINSFCSVQTDIVLKYVI